MKSESDVEMDLKAYKLYSKDFQSRKPRKPSIPEAMLQATLPVRNAPKALLMQAIDAPLPDDLQRPTDSAPPPAIASQPVPSGQSLLCVMCSIHVMHLKLGLMHTTFLLCDARPCVDVVLSVIIFYCEDYEQIIQPIFIPHLACSRGCIRFRTGASTGQEAQKNGEAAQEDMRHITQ